MTDILRKMIINMDLSNFYQNKDCQKILNILNHTNETSRIVGGYVRNYLRNIETKDIDIATKLNPDEVIELLSKEKIKTVPTGLSHGTVSAFINDQIFEITTLRKDSNHDGRHADVEFTDDWEEDASRRDFTINAIYMNYNGEIYDPFNGVSDLNNSIVKFIGDPEKRIKEDYLRIFRYYRFLSIYNSSTDNKTRKLIQKASQSNNNTYLKELIWREFFQQILYHFPETITKSFKPKYDRIEWINNEEDFKKWCNGETGFPFVDAGMRELNNTGFMHNRVRMLVGSFLCKHLLIDWRWGEAYFREKLYDYETASNVGNWQWVAGCGVDAAPYFRIFNPHEQIKKFDKNFTYIKKWVPEYKDSDYAKEIIDHKYARERCLITYKKALNN